MSYQILFYTIYYKFVFTNNCFKIVLIKHFLKFPETLVLKKTFKLPFDNHTNYNHYSHQLLSLYKFGSWFGSSTVLAIIEILTISSLVEKQSW